MAFAVTKPSQPKELLRAEIILQQERFSVVLLILPKMRFYQTLFQPILIPPQAFKVGSFVVMLEKAPVLCLGQDGTIEIFLVA
jgi:hypothetical protein